MVRCWNSLYREAVDALSLEVFKARLDGALGNLVWYEMWRLVVLPVVGGLEFQDLWGSFQPKPHYDSVIFFYCNSSTNRGSEHSDSYH